MKTAKEKRNDFIRGVAADVSLSFDINGVSQKDCQRAHNYAQDGCKASCNENYYYRLKEFFIGE